MKRLFVFLLFFSFAFSNTVNAKQAFTLSGMITGLQKGDTLRFERVNIMDWSYEHAFDIIVQNPDTFHYEGTQTHDQYYLMTYHPKIGEPRIFETTGKSLIITDNDTINMTGTTDEIYYCTLKGGIYDDPLLAETLRIEDSLHMVRNGYIRYINEPGQKDTTKYKEYVIKFNLFYENNPGVDRAKAASDTYIAANPQGTLYLLLDYLPSVSYNPVEKSKAIYDSYSDELKSSYYGHIMAEMISNIERLAAGQPAPDFTVVSTDGQRLAKADYAGKYLLIYHWGMCPGSILIDGQVMALHEKYKTNGLEVLGITESISTIRDVYKDLPEGSTLTIAGETADLSLVLTGMLEHKWTEVEIDTDYPENKTLSNIYSFSGWPFFVLIGPDGTIRARGFSEAFFEAQKILNEELGGNGLK